MIVYGRFMLYKKILAKKEMKKQGFEKELEKMVRRLAEH